MRNSSIEISDSNRLKNISIAAAVVTFLWRKETRITGIKFLITIVTKFFYPQYQRKLRIKKRKIVNVDHELDKLIPFSADYLQVYMGFSNLWIKSIYFLYKEFGKKSLPHIDQFIRSVDQLYRIGFEVSDSCQSTTTRPDSGKNIKLKILHWIDPHLHCIPSLHVMIVCFNHLRISSIIKELTDQSGEYEKELEYLWDQAVLITNSILYMKQHSINCISAGLFALSAECPELNDNYTQNLISGLRNLNIESIDRFEEIYSHITQLYADFIKLSEYSSNKEILINFLLKYKELS